MKLIKCSDDEKKVVVVLFRNPTIRGYLTGRLEAKGYFVFEVANASEFRSILSTIRSKKIKIHSVFAEASQIQEDIPDCKTVRFGSDLSDVEEKVELIGL